MQRWRTGGLIAAVSLLFLQVRQMPVRLEGHSKGHVPLRRWVPGGTASRSAGRCGAEGSSKQKEREKSRRSKARSIQEQRCSGYIAGGVRWPRLRGDLPESKAVRKEDFVGRCRAPAARCCCYYCRQRAAPWRCCKRMAARAAAATGTQLAWLLLRGMSAQSLGRLLGGRPLQPVFHHQREERQHRQQHRRRKRCLRVVLLRLFKRRWGGKEGRQEGEADAAQAEQAASAG